MKTFVVIPAFNEAETIKDIILEAKEYASNIIVVDDASTDDTFKIAKSAGAAVLRHIINRGQGAALRTGTKFALRNGADIIVHMDSDGQHQAKDILPIIEPLAREEVDIVLGSRFLSNTSQIPWSKRAIIIPLARIINWLISGLWLTDAHNGWRAMTRKAASLINIQQDRMAHNTDIPVQIAKHNLKYKEVAVEIIYKKYGQGLSGGMEILLDLIKSKIVK